MGYQGGYYLRDEDLVRTTVHGHTAALENPLSASSLAAVNAIQETPWRINTFTLDLMREAWVGGGAFGGLPSAEPKPLPPRMDADLWERLSEDARRDHKLKLSEIHAFNASAESERSSFLDKLSVAEELRDRPEIWFPHSVDFRGRIYPLPAGGPHPQSDGLGRALLMFAEGKPLGPAGLYWLAVRAAGCYGMDKLPLDERVKWVEEEAVRLRNSLQDPCGSL